MSVVKQLWAEKDYPPKPTYKPLLPMGMRIGKAEKQLANRRKKHGF